MKIMRNTLTWLCGKKYGILVLLLIFVVLSQMVFNIDSYLYANNGHYDSAIFFFCGKSLMNGYVPYVDYTDSKGLLLWIIYGIGFLIHNYSYIGVFWIACLFFWGTFWIGYKTARLYLDKPDALLASLSMAIPYWYWNFYTEGRAEYFCIPFIAYVLYQLLKIMHQPCSMKGLSWEWIGVGGGLVAVIMMKWSVGLMMVSLIVSIGVWAWKRRELTSYIVSFVVGAMVFSLPFLVYFVATDSLDVMWSEYFQNTLSSVSEPLQATIVSYSREWGNLFFTKRILYIMYTLPLLLLWRRREWFATALPWLSAMFFIALAIRHDNFGHYITVVAPFAIFAVVCLIKAFRSRGISLRYYFVAFMLAFAYLVWGKIHYNDNFFTKAKDVEEFERINWRMSRIKDPTILVMGQYPGFAMGYTRPYCRYWITQMGQTEAMFTAQDKALREAKADFVCLIKSNFEKYDPVLLSKGYSFMDEYEGFWIYSKKKIPPVPGGFHVTPMDILTKRNMAEW